MAGLGCDKVAEHLLSMCKALGSTSAGGKTRAIIVKARSGGTYLYPSTREDTETPKTDKGKTEVEDGEMAQWLTELNCSSTEPTSASSQRPVTPVPEDPTLFGLSG